MDAVIGEETRQFHRKVFSQTVRDVRGRQGMTQQALAAALGVEQRQVVRLEHGDVAPTLEVIQAVAKALGVPTFAFVFPIFPTVESADTEDVEALDRWVLREVQSRFKEALARPDLAALIVEVASLVERDLNRVTEVARAFRQAQWVPKEFAEPSPLDAALTVIPRPRVPRRGHGKTKQR